MVHEHGAATEDPAADSGGLPEGEITHPPFFICGNDRSGTTMLRAILDRGPDVAIPTPSFFLIDFAPVRRGARDLSVHENAVAFAREVWEHPKVRLWNLEGDAPVPPPGLSHDEAYRFAVEGPYRADAKRHGKRRFADKTAPYVFHIDELLAIWPEGRVVVLVRDGRDVAMSVKQVPFGANNAWAAARDWARGIRVGLEAERRHPGQVLRMRYEDLVSDPAPNVQRICEFLGLAYTDEMLAIEHTAGDRIEVYQKEWHRNVWSGINTRSVGKWRTRMSARDQAVFAAVSGTELAELGYDLGEHAGGVRGLRVQAPLLRAHDMAMRVFNFVRHRIVRERGRELRFVIARRLRR